MSTLAAVYNSMNSEDQRMTSYYQSPAGPWFADDDEDTVVDESCDYKNEYLASPSTTQEPFGKGIQVHLLWDMLGSAVGAQSSSFCEDDDDASTVAPHLVQEEEEEDEDMCEEDNAIILSSDDLLGDDETIAMCYDM